MLKRIVFLVFWFLFCFYSMTYLTSLCLPLDNGIKLEDIQMDQLRPFLK